MGIPNFSIFSEEDIPYGILKQYGLTQEMIDDLPENIMRHLLMGRATPMLPIKITDKEGVMGTTNARICLVNKEDGTIDVKFIPEWRQKELGEFEEEQQRQLILGKVILHENEDKGMCYVQYDSATHLTMTVPVSIVQHNIELLTDGCKLTNKEIKDITNGEITEKTLNGEIISIGIDLNDSVCCRICKGDKRTWKEEAKSINVPKYNFGIYGCWVNDLINNSLSYVPEDEYTEEMINEMKLIGTQKAAFAQMGGLHY